MRKTHWLVEYEDANEKVHRTNVPTPHMTHALKMAAGFHTDARPRIVLIDAETSETLFREHVPGHNGIID